MKSSRNGKIEEQGSTGGRGADRKVPCGKPVHQAVRKALREPRVPAGAAPTLTTLCSAGSPQRGPPRSSRPCGAPKLRGRGRAASGTPGGWRRGVPGGSPAGKARDRGPGMGVPPPPPHSPNGQTTAAPGPPRLKRRDAPPPPHPPITGRLSCGAECLHQSALAIRAAAGRRWGVWEL